MASYHFSMTQIQRSKGHSAVAAAAYRARTEIRDERTGKTENYTQKPGFQHAEILLPEGAPEWMRDRSQLWNTAEAAEKRVDAQVAREVTIALPKELSDEQRYELTGAFVTKEFVSRGMAADVCWHKPDPKSGDHLDNYHVHVLLSMRKVTADGFFRTKTREWNAASLLDDWRASWCSMQNDFLARHGHSARVDHRTLFEQRREAEERGDHAKAALLDREPEIHVGPKARAAARGGRTPASQERVVELRRRPRRKDASDRRGRTRAVDYRSIDQGNRAEWNAEIIERNRARARKLADRREIQKVRLQGRQQRFNRGAAEIDRLLAIAPGSLRIAAGPKRTPEERTMLELRRAHLKRRSSLIATLLRDVEKYLAQFQIAHRQRQERHRTVSRGWMEEFSRAVNQGRGRSRLPP